MCPWGIHTWVCSFIHRYLVETIIVCVLGAAGYKGYAPGVDGNSWDHSCSDSLFSMVSFKAQLWSSNFCHTTQVCRKLTAGMKQERLCCWLFHHFTLLFKSNESSYLLVCDIPVQEFALFLFPGFFFFFLPVIFLLIF